MKRVKAWAVVSGRGSIWISETVNDDSISAITKTKGGAERWMEDFSGSGERVVPVEVVIKEGK